MIEEVLDPNSGAILFKKDKDSRNIELLLKTVALLSAKVQELESEIKEIKSKM